MDKAHLETEEKIKQIDRHINKIYKEHYKEIYITWTSFFQKLNKKLEPLREDIEKAEIGKIRKAKNVYKKAFLKETIRNDDFKKITNKITNNLYQLNKETAKYINQNMPEIYALNFNYIGEQLEKELSNYNYMRVDIEDVEKYGDITKTKIDEEKDKKWNEKKISAIILVSAIMVIPIKRIIKKMDKIILQNRESAYRNTRDSATDAESKGRLDQMYRASDLGFDIRKQWKATKDNRTRTAHAQRDGTVIPLNADFVPGLSRPRDPNGPANEIYNCRCTLGFVIPGFGKYSTETARKGIVKGSYKKSSSFRGTETIEIEKMSYKEWQEWRERSVKN